VTGTEEDNTIPAHCEALVFHAVGTMGFSGRYTGFGARPLPGHMTPRKPLYLSVLFHKIVLAMLP